MPEPRWTSPPQAPPSVPGWESEALKVVQSISDGFCALDGNWRFTFLNPATVQMLSPRTSDAASLLGKEFWEIFPSTLGTIVEHEFRRAAREGAPSEFEVFFDPGRRWLAFRIYPLPDGGLSAHIRDVSLGKTIAATVKLEQEKYEAIFASVEQGFCVIEMIYNAEGHPVDYRFIEVNPAFERHTGWADAGSRTAREILPSLEAHWAERYGRVAATGEPQLFEERSDEMGRDFSVYAWRIGPPEHRRVALLFSDITSRKLAEKEVARIGAESRQRLAELETLLDVLPVGIGIAMDCECRHIRLNPALAEMLGLEHDANASKTAPDGERPESFKVMDEAGQPVPDNMLPMQIAAREGREMRDVELTLSRNDGAEERLLAYAAPLFDDRGNSRGSVGVFINITERRAAEERHRFLLKLDDAVRPLTDPADIVESAARILGEHLHADRCAWADVEADEDTFNLWGDYCRGVPSVVGRYTFSQFGTEILRLMRENRPFVSEDIETHQPPVEDLSSYRATMIRAGVCVPLHKAGRFVGAMAVHQATPRKWTQREVDLVLNVANRCWEALERLRVTRVLAESEERFRSMADNIAQLAWMTDADGWITWYNRRWFEYTGTTLTQMQEAGWGSVHHPDHSARVTAKWNDHLRSGKEWEDTFPLLGADGEYRWFLSRAFPIRDSQNKILRWFGTNTDVTEQRQAAESLAQAKEQAEAASRAKDEFLAALSHELRTPLTPVLLSAAAMQEDEGLPRETRNELAMMRRNIELEARLIDDLLDLTRISRGKLNLRLQKCDVHCLLGLAMEIAREDALAKGLTIELELRAQHPRFQGDPARIQQVFWNLFKNAIKFTPIGGRIIARTWDADGKVQVEVSDSGIGIEPEALRRIFLPFDQGTISRDQRFGGLGLGLAISQAIVEMHGGHICASSPGRGRGASFYVSLPSIQESSGVAPIKAESTGNEANAIRHLKLLLVEDHEPTLRILARLLAREGHTISTAMTVTAAKELAATTKFEAVISDIGLPDGTGIELMRHLQSEHGLQGIALTGYGMEEDMKRSRDAGFVSHLVKPVDLAQLRLAIAHFASEIPPATV